MASLERSDRCRDRRSTAKDGRERRVANDYLAEMDRRSADRNTRALRGLTKWLVGSRIVYTGRDAAARNCHLATALGGCGRTVGEAHRHPIPRSFRWSSSAVLVSLSPWGRCVVLAVTRASGRGHEGPHAHQVVRRETEGEHPTDPRSAAVAGLAQEADRLGPSEDPLDAPASEAALEIAGMARGPRVDRAATIGDVLSDVRGEALRTHRPDELRGVVRAVRNRGWPAGGEWPGSRAAARAPRHARRTRSPQ